ncbi:alpha-D-ribose 1-methylphosphonate 5-triphosphate diphosphatase [Roseobacter sp. A03A-229]
MTLPPLTLNGAMVLGPAGLTDAPLSIRDGKITEEAGHPVDLRGNYVLPGIIDLHGDAFERQVAPRPSAVFPLDQALRATDCEAAAHGVTTAWMAQSWSWEGGLRGPEFTLRLLDALATYRPQAMTDLRVQLRIETHTVETLEQLKDAIAIHGVDYAVFNNHLPEARQMARSNPEEILGWAKKAKRTPDEHMAVVDEAFLQAPRVPRYLCNLAAFFDAQGLRYGSHDDGSAETRCYYNEIGAKICEFPTSQAAARAARSLENPILMGAPNVVRGGSQSGNVAALELIKAGLCDVLVSDYHYPSLAQAAFALVTAGTLPLAEAWALISSRPARVMGLSDRGTLAPGKRADLIVVDQETHRVTATISAGRLAHLSGETGQRFMSGVAPLAQAAE